MCLSESLDGAEFVVGAEKLSEDCFQLSVEVATLYYKGVSTRASGQRSGIGCVIRGDDDDQRSIRKLFYVSCGFDAIQARHVNIHQNQFRLDGQSVPDCLAAIGRGGGKYKDAFRREDLRKGFQHERRIVGNKRP